MRMLIRTIEWFTLVSGYIAGLIIVPLILATCYEVFSRYILGQPTIWAFEVAYMGMGAHFLLGIAYTLQTKQHIRITLIYDTLPPRGRAAIDGLAYLFLVLPFTAWMIYGLSAFFLDAYRWGERTGQSAWNPVIWPFRLVFLVAFVLLAAQLIAEILKCGLVVAGKPRTEEES